MSDSTPRPVDPHPRDLVCEAAGTELMEFADQWRARHQLSAGEFAYLIAVLAVRHAQLCAVAERRTMPPPKPDGAG